MTHDEWNDGAGAGAAARRALVPPLCGGTSLSAAPRRARAPRSLPAGETGRPAERPQTRSPAERGNERVGHASGRPFFAFFATFAAVARRIAPHQLRQSPPSAGGTGKKRASYNAY